MFGNCIKAMSVVPFTVQPGEMSNETFNDLKGKVLAAGYGPNIDWWEVRIAVNECLNSDFNRPYHRSSPEIAFNMVYQQLSANHVGYFGYEERPLPYRSNNPDGSPDAAAIAKY